MTTNAATGNLALITGNLAITTGNLALTTGNLVINNWQFSNKQLTIY